MTGRLHLRVTTPMRQVIDAPDVVSLRAEDDSGSFGIWPGHADFLTVLVPTVLRWHGPDGAPRFCALRAGLLTVTGGRDVAIACREAVPGPDLPGLEQALAGMRAADADAERQARVEHIRLHAGAVRQMMRFARPDQPPGLLDHPPAIGTAAGPGRSGPAR